MQRNYKTKLKLNRETVRTLGEVALGRAVGGQASTDPGYSVLYGWADWTAYKYCRTMADCCGPATGGA